jgi:antitoxin (DNA-binding transcriptional repressor) of toxin-antitoxin stability system
MPATSTTDHVRVGVRELRANLSSVLRQARHGTSFLVMSHNEVVAEIRPPSKSVSTRCRPGALEGKIHMADDFDVLPSDVLDAIEGNEH